MIKHRGDSVAQLREDVTKLAVELPPPPRTARLVKDL